MFHLNENPENRFSLVSVVILASRSLTTDFCLLIDCSTKSRLLVISMSVSKGLVLRYKNTSGLASRYM